MSDAPQNPYVGAKPFERQKLFGRTREVTELKYLLTAERIVMLYSPSGAGKSSLVNAGLIPAVEDRFDVWGPTRVNSIPPPGVRNRYTWSAVAGFEKSTDIAADIRLKDFVEKRRSDFNLLLIFDQFEEVLRVDQVDIEAKKAFFVELGELLKEDTALWALFVLREDYLAAFDFYSKLVPTHFQNRYRIDRLTRDAAAQAIEKPTEDSPRKYGKGAVEHLVENLAKVKVQGLDGVLHEEPGHYVEPLQLQVVCFDVWERMNRVNAEDLSIDIEDIRDVDQALRNYYENTVDKIAGMDWAVRRSIREWFQYKLITADGIRNQVRHETTQSGGLANHYVQQIVDTYLVRAEPRGVIWYELAHDRLVEPVRESNREWLLKSDAETMKAYDRTVADIAMGDQKLERELRDWFQHLAGGKSAEPLAAVAVKAVEESGLVTGPGPDYRLRHECLKALIPDRNRAYLERHVGSLRDRAGAWEARGKPEWLLSEDMEEARKWQGDPSLLPLEQEFLDKSLKRHELEAEKAAGLEREREQAKKTELYLRWAVGLALVAIASSGWALKSAMDARAARRVAEVAQKRADDLFIASANAEGENKRLAKLALESGITVRAGAMVPQNAAARKCLVYIHVRKEVPEQRTEAVQMMDRLRANGCEVPGIETLSVGPAQREIRYFRKGQSEAVKKAAEWAGEGLRPSYIDRYERALEKGKGSEANVPEHFEIWFDPPKQVSATALVGNLSKDEKTRQATLVRLASDYGDSQEAIKEALRTLGTSQDKGVVLDTMYFLQTTNPQAWTAEQKQEVQEQIAEARKRFSGDSQIDYRGDAIAATLNLQTQKK